MLLRAIVVPAPAAPLAVTGTRGTGRIVKPPMKWKPIPSGAKRRQQMAAYSKRHYGLRTWHLRNPKVIVEHYTDGLSWSSAWNHFASNAKHNGE